MDWNNIKKGSSKNKRNFRGHATELDPQTVRAASGRNKAQKGRRQYPLTTRLPAEQSEEIMSTIRQFSEDLGMTQNDTQLWCLLRGLKALSDGESLEAEEKIMIKPVLPKF